jgi:hypothetical protein
VQVQVQVQVQVPASVLAQEPVPASVLAQEPVPASALGLAQAQTAGWHRALTRHRLRIPPGECSKELRRQ